jgi:hypothetical protein
LTTLSILILFFSFSIYDELFRVEKWRNSMICFLHLWLKFQKEHKSNLWLSRISSFESVVKVYVELPSELWIPNVQAVYIMLFIHKTILLGALLAVITTYLSWRRDGCLTTFGSINIDVERVLIYPLSFLILLCISDLTLFTHSEGIYRSSFACFAQCLA